jgi:hypothetical protein
MAAIAKHPGWLVLAIEKLHNVSTHDIVSVKKHWNSEDQNKNMHPNHTKLVLSL